MSLKSIDLKEVKEIVDWVNLTEDVREFSLKLGELELFISRNKRTGQASPAPSIPASASATPPLPKPVIEPALAEVAQARSASLAADEVLIKAPMVGTFYAGPKPGAPNFVNVGEAVSADTVLCIVEVMKLMNNIEAGVEGSVTKIFVTNEQPVEYGQPLMIIKKRG
jgi:acetyl-CoA carboxylase biotin carboxyl carrier protein